MITYICILLAHEVSLVIVLRICIVPRHSRICLYFSLGLPLDPAQADRGTFRIKDPDWIRVRDKLCIPRAVIWGHTECLVCHRRPMLEHRKLLDEI